MTFQLKITNGITLINNKSGRRSFGLSIKYVNEKKKVEKSYGEYSDNTVSI